jgi:hypothetical protein
VGAVRTGEIVVVVGAVKIGEIVVVVGEIRVGEIVVVVGEIVVVVGEMVVVVGESRVGEIVVVVGKMVVVVGESRVGEIVVVVGEIVVVVGEIVMVGEIVVVVGEIRIGESIGFSSSGAVNTLPGATVVAGVVSLTTGASRVTRAAGLPPSAWPSSSRRDCGVSTGIGVGLPKMPVGGTTSTGGRLLGSATKAVCSRLTRMATPARF